MRLLLSKIRLLTVVFLVAMINSCTKEDRHPVPIVPVEFSINLEYQFIELNSVGGWVNVTGGFGGIVIYRMSIDQFTAFDRACPLHPFDSQARIRVEDPPLAVCPVCETSFLLLDGSVFMGEAKHPLRPYRVLFSDPFLRISN